MDVDVAEAAEAPEAYGCFNEFFTRPLRAGVRPIADGQAEIAANTGDAVRAGALNAVAGAVERAIRVLRSNAYEPDVVLTGGDASRILNALDEQAVHRPNLVLQGLMHMLESA